MRGQLTVLVLLAPGSGATEALARHEAVFTTFCDTGSVAGGDCWCQGGSATAAIGDGSWLWHELVGSPCVAQPDDRCDCTSCGGAADDCPHGAVDGTPSCWQCQGVNAPECAPTDALKRCEVEVHGTHGAEKYYVTEVCPSTHPCNRCKEPRLQRCAAFAPLAVDLCGTTWHHVFEPSRYEARGYVTLSCYPRPYGEEPPRSDATAAVSSGACYSIMPGDARETGCEAWCDAGSAADHCKWCKCRGCPAMADACAPVVREIERQAEQRAVMLAECGELLDCKSWCNLGNCGNCACAACERCGPIPQLPMTETGSVMPTRSITAAAATQTQTAGCHGWCVQGSIAGMPWKVICASSKCLACSVCKQMHS
jgi:hypothetical protein